MKLPSPCLTGMRSRCPGSQRDVKGVSVRSTLQRDVAADEGERGVSDQHAREQARLAEDLEAVADAEHGPAVRRRTRSPPSMIGREAGDRAAAQVVAVGEAAGQDDGRRAPRAARSRRARRARPRRPSAASAQAASWSSCEPEEDDDGDPGARGRHASSTQLDLVALDQRVGEQARATSARARRSASSRSAVSSSRSTTRPIRTPDDVEADLASEPSDRLALRVVDAGLGPHEHRRLHLSTTSGSAR